MATPVRIDDELRDRIDAQRGDVPRERFVRTLLGEALEHRAAPPGRSFEFRDGWHFAAQGHPRPQANTRSQEWLDGFNAYAARAASGLGVPPLPSSSSAHQDAEYRAGCEHAADGKPRPTAQERSPWYLEGFDDFTAKALPQADEPYRPGPGAGPVGSKANPVEFQAGWDFAKTGGPQPSANERSPWWHEGYEAFVAKAKTDAGAVQ